MTRLKLLGYGSLVLILAAGAGCARAARDTTGFARENSIIVDAPFKEAWQAVKGVLREQKLDIYTRDKRGTFVAYSKMHRRWRIFQPHRMKFTIEIASITPNETKIYIETVKQVYGVTLLTYPDWHDRKTTDDRMARAILDAVQAKVEPVEEDTGMAPADS